MINRFFHSYPYENFHELNLDWILSKINKFEETLNDWKELANELQEGLKDIDNIKNEIASIESDLDYIKNRIIELDNFESQLSDAFNLISQLQNSFDNIELHFNVIESEIAGVKVYIDDKFDILDSKLFESQTLLMLKINQLKLNIQSQIDDLKSIIDSLDTSVYNPWISKKISNQENTSYAFNHLADECLTAEEYLTLSLSAYDYSNFEISSNDYSEFGKKKLHFRWVYSPCYGFKQEINNVLTSIINYIKNTLTADDYALLNLTADEYALLDLTALDYFEYPKESTTYATESYVLNSVSNAINNAVFFDSNAGDGLSSAEYSKLMINT